MERSWRDSANSALDRVVVGAERSDESGGGNGGKGKAMVRGC